MNDGNRMDWHNQHVSKDVASAFEHMNANVPTKYTLYEMFCLVEDWPTSTCLSLKSNSCGFVYRFMFVF